MPQVSISKRRLKAYEAAVETCRAFRVVIAKPHCEVVQGDWDMAWDSLIRWIRLFGKTAYEPPKPLRKRGR